MSREPKKESQWKVKCLFEPSRMAQTIVAGAYERIVPRHSCVIQVEPNNSQQQKTGWQRMEGGEDETGSSGYLCPSIQ